MRRLPLPFLLLLLARCSLEPGDVVGRGQREVIGGAPDQAHPGVVVVAISPRTVDARMCSGALIGPRAVLTAAHCAPDGLPIDVLFGLSSASPERVVAVDQVHRYPAFTGDQASSRAGLDLAVLHLAEEVSVVPLAYARDPDLLEPGGKVTLVGAGESVPGSPETGGVRRAVEVRITGVCDRLLAFGDREHGACAGDSGGVLVAGWPGEERVVGVVSYSRSASCEPPTYAVRVAPYAAWLTAVQAGVVDCDAGCPERSEACASVDGAAPDGPGPDGPAAPRPPRSGGCAAAPAGAAR